MPRMLPGALLTLAAATFAAGCDADAPLVASASQVGDSVVVTPATARLEGVGATRAFTATVYRGGEPITADVSWATDDFSVVTVDAGGVAVAQGPGQTFVIASTGQAADSAFVTVDIVSGPPSP